MKTPVEKIAEDQAIGLLTYRPSYLTSVIIVALLSILTSAVQAEELKSERVYSWTFNHNDDRNSDRQPDGWKRVRDRKHPAYIDIEITPRDAEQALRAKEEQGILVQLYHAYQVGHLDPNYIPESTPRVIVDLMDKYVFNDCLEIRMDGAAAELISPVFPLDSRFSYSLDAEMACQGLKGHFASVELELLDQNQKLIDSISTPKMTGTQPWQAVTTQIATANDNQLAWGRVHLKVKPIESKHISGSVQFDSIAVHRLPRLSLTADIAHHVALPGKPFEIRCVGMGIDGNSRMVRFELKDLNGEVIKNESIELMPISRSDRYPNPKSPARTNEQFVSTEATGAIGNVEPKYDGEAIWRMQIDQPGLYRVGVNLGQTSAVHQREILIGVIPQHPNIKAGPFGWSIKEFNDIVTPEKVPNLATEYGAGWIKFPVWFDEADVKAADRLVDFTERLQLNETVCVGRIGTPPPEIKERFGEGITDFPVSTMFRDPTVWEPLLEPVLTRMGMKIDWFQIGEDDDLSLVGKSDLVDLLNEVRLRMQSYSQELKIAINWTWADELQSNPPAPWSGVQYSSDPQLTPKELQTYTSALKNNDAAIFVPLEILDRSSYETVGRVRDLAERMVKLRTLKIEAAFLPDPFNQQTGLFDRDLNCSEMLLPWTHLVSALGTGEYQGTVLLPSESENHVFGEKDNGIMIIWSNQPIKEHFFFGSKADAIDVWGKRVPIEEMVLPSGEVEQHIAVGNYPVIVRGVNVDLIKWRQKVEVMVKNLVNNIGVVQDLPLSIENTLPQTVSGKLTIESKTLLQDGKIETNLQLTPGRSHPRTVPLTIRPDASAGSHDLKLNFNINADRNYNFSCYRDIRLGTGDVDIQWNVSRKTDEMVELRVDVTNNTNESVSFDCKLFPLNLPYLRFQILDAKPGTTSKDIRLQLPISLKDTQAWIRCEQLQSSRILNYRIDL